MTDAAWSDEDWLDETPYVDVPTITLHVTDPEPVGTILGPDGEPLHTVFPPARQFGFGR